MPVAPPESPAVAAGLHRAVAGFDRAADAYRRARPDYPDEAVDWMVGRLGLGPGSPVADVGAGTGKLTGPLVARGLAVVAVEPVADMRRVLRSLLPGVPAVAALAELLPFADRSMAAVTLGQALHWFATPRALAELVRVLGPGGGLGVAWNRRDDTDPLQAELSRLLRPLRGDTPSHEDGRWRAALEAAPGLGPLEHTRVSWVQDLDVGGVVDRVASISFVATAGTGSRAELLGRVETLAEAAADGRGRCAFPYVTDAFVARRR